MKKRNTHRKPIIVKDVATSKAEILEFQAHALTMQTGTQAQAALAFEKIYNRYKEWMRFIILRSLKLDAASTEDVLQDVFMKVFRSINTYTSEYALSTWLHKITLNAIIDFKRRGNVEVLSIDSLHSDHGSNSDENVGISLFQLQDETADSHKIFIKEERKELVRRAISESLSNEKEKIVLNLFFMKGLSNEEIHVQTKMPIGTIKALLFRAKEKVKKYLVTESPDLLLMDRFYNKNLQATN